MEHNVKIMEPEQLIPELLKLLDDVPCVPLVISGDSMRPFLAHGRDTVYLSRLDAAPKRGDMILYRRDNGRYILHRVYKVEADTFTMVGDAQTYLEPGIRRDQMLARVSAVSRKGKRLEKGSLCWDFFEKGWIRMVPLRPAVNGAYARIKKTMIALERNK